MCHLVLFPTSSGGIVYIRAFFSPALLAMAHSIRNYRRPSPLRAGKFETRQVLRIFESSSFAISFFFKASMISRSVSKSLATNKKLRVRKQKQILVGFKTGKPVTLLPDGPF